MDRVGRAPLEQLACSLGARGSPRVGDPVVRSDSFMLQVSLVASGLGVGLVPEPSAQHFGLVPVKLSPALREAASEWPVAELFLVTHRALRQVPRVSVVWDLIVARMAARKFG